MAREFGYGLCPLWSWNDRIEPEGIRNDLDWMTDVGFDGCFLHPRPGVRTKFVSDEWLERAQDAVNEATDRGADVWLYDEDSYPSGFAGGQLLERAPEYRCRGLRYERAVDWDNLPHDSVCEADLARTFALDGDEYERIDRASDGKTASERPVPDADAYVAFWLEFAPDRARYNGHNYVDTRDPAAVEAFLEIVYEGYEGVLGDRFGEDVLGVFTDEPNGAHHLEERALMWTSDFSVAFREAHGYDVLDRLPALCYEMADAPAVRFDYYKLLNDLLVSNFTAQIGEWCVERDLHFTGHFWEHAWPDLSHTAAIMPHYAEMSVPGIDCLFRPGAADEQMSNVRMVRELDSVATQFDRRAMCESWGGAGWSVTRTDLKRMADWLLVLGVDFFVPHFVHYSLEGARKRDWPPSYGSHFEGATALKPLFESIEATAAWLDAGRRSPSTAVLHPSTTVWTEWVPEDDGNVPSGRSFESFVRDLELAGVTFDLLDETILEGYADVDDDGLRIGSCTYDTVVIPESTSNVISVTQELLADAPVEVLLVGDADLARVDGRVPESPPALSWETERLAVDELHDRLRSTSSVTHDAPGELYCRATATDDEWRCLLVNPSDERCEGVTVTAPEACEDALATDRFQSKSWRPDRSGSGDDRSATIDLLPYQSVCLTFGIDSPVDAATTGSAAGLEYSASDGRGSSAGVDMKSSTSLDTESSTPSGLTDAPNVIEPSAIDVERDGPNVAILDFVDLEVDGDRLEREYVLAAQDAVFERHGVDYCAQPFEIRHWWQLVRDGHKRRRKPGFEATFRFMIEEEISGPIEAVVENGPLFDITVNGEDVAFDDGTWLDDAFHCADVTSHLIPGENELTVAADRVSIEHPLEACYLLGDVTVDTEDPTCLRLRPADPDALEVGSIAEQGHPFYTGWVTYSGTVDYNESWGSYSLEVGDFDGLAVTVIVNGERVCPIGEPSTNGDVSAALVDGENDVELSLYVGPENALGPLHHESTPRDEGLAHPWMFTPHDRDTFREGHQVGPAGIHEPFRLVRDR